MSTIVEQRAHPLGGHAAYDYDHTRALAAPQFTNPWAPTPQIYNQQQPPNSDHYAHRAHFQPTPPSQPLTSLEAVSRSFAPEPHYATAPTTVAAPAYGAAPVADRFPTDHYSGSYNSPAYESRYSGSFAQPAQGRNYRQAIERGSFSDGLNHSQGMVMMNQQDYTPRAQYAPRNGSSDSYGFPAGHSDQGSISSASSYPYYGSYGGSADGSVAGSSTTDYSSASEDAHRPLPPPSQLINGYPADPTQMMTQFNSKAAVTAQKKHKCKICDKRFTRPSSLQTHMYSHTGEKPFACDFDGCGRHFSVVSNLRRHKKCHKSDGSDGSASPEA